MELDAAPGLDHTQDLALRSPGPGVRSVEAAATFLDRRLVTPLVAAGRARRLAVRGPLVALNSGAQRGAREAPASHSLDLAGDERRLAGTARAHAGTFWGLRRGLAGAGSRSGRGSAGSRAGFVFGTSIGSTMIVRDGPGRVMSAESPPAVRILWMRPRRAVGRRLASRRFRAAHPCAGRQHPGIDQLVSELAAARIAGHRGDELIAPEGQQAGLGAGDDRGGAGDVADQRDLTERLSAARRAALNAVLEDSRPRPMRSDRSGRRDPPA